MKFGSIAVTGANGLLGREVLQALSKDADVVSLDIAPGQPDVRSRYIDVTSFESLRHGLDGHDAVVHMAALLYTPNQGHLFAVNVVGTWNVLQAARDVGIRKVVLLSSECATGVLRITQGPLSSPDYLPIDEAHPLRPMDAYGVSKQAMETIGQAFVRQGDMQVVVLRPTSIYVPGMEQDMREARAKDDPNLWLYVEGFDVAEAVRLALDYEGAAYDCFFVTARDTFAPEETLAFVERIYGESPEIRHPDLYRGDPHATIFDTSRAERCLGFRPKSDWRRFLGEAGAKAM